MWARLADDDGSVLPSTVQPRLSRGAQLAEGLYRVLASWLAGNLNRIARPRLYAVADTPDLTPMCDGSCQHHVTAREDGGLTAITNLVALCRRCHRRVHGHGWQQRLDRDGTYTVSRGRHRYTTRPPLRQPA